MPSKTSFLSHSVIFAQGALLDVNASTVEGVSPLTTCYVNGIELEAIALLMARNRVLQRHRDMRDQQPSDEVALVVNEQTGQIVWRSYVFKHGLPNTSWTQERLIDCEPAFA